VGIQESGHLFLCSHGRMLPRWSEAFGAGRAGKIQTTRASSESSKVSLVWLRLEQGVPVAAQLERLAPPLKFLPCVVLSDRPTDEEALAAFSAGARGYCNTHAAAQVLIQVAAVVLQGGLWIGESLMQRLVSATSRIQAVADVTVSPVKRAWAECLTDREKEVAIVLAAGASNKEIARELGITERTVKAHVGAILEKLHVRDRLQLSLVVNGQVSGQAQRSSSI
jgi:two-component system nitrate/nitrite response regulator NarL